MKTYTCKRCLIQFESDEWRKRVYCSRECKGLAERNFDLDVFKQLVTEGLEGKDIASILRVSRSRVTRALHAHGLHAIWTESKSRVQRDKTIRKRQRPNFGGEITCVNSLLAGWKLATGVSAQKTAAGLSANTQTEAA